jgi:hypothetical protein
MLAHIVAILPHLTDNEPLREQLQALGIDLENESEEEDV